jgi:OMF family outer membrane factor
MFSLFFFNQFGNAQTELSFNNIDSLFKYAENHSISIKTGEQQVLLAKWQKISAKAGIINFKIQTSFSLIDNIQLPVTYLPAEAFGGESGTFKEVTTGQQYVGNLNVAPQIDIVNPASWARLKSANINSELTDVNNQIVRKLIYESISASYFNIISLNDQIEITRQNLLTADTLQMIIQNKYTEGIVRQQDLNDAIINQITLADKLEQLKIGIQQQYYGLKVLCDIPETDHVVITEKLNHNQQFSIGLQASNELQYKSALLKVEQSKADLNTNRLSQYPTVSLVAYDAWQQNSKNMFFDNNVNWRNSQYFGLRISLPFPDINRITLSKSSDINKTIAQQNAEHAKLQDNIANTQLNLDYEKAYSQFRATKQIYLIKEENYQMALNQFNMSILSSDKLIIAFNDMLTSRLNYTSALANLNYTMSIIEITNTIR